VSIVPWLLGYGLRHDMMCEARDEENMLGGSSVVVRKKREKREPYDEVMMTDFVMRKDVEVC
jgi:hypothetical protein